MIVRALAYVAIIVVSGANGGRSEAKAIHTTICELDAKPGLYDQKIVRIRARIETAPPTFIEDIFDENCLRHSLRLAGPDPDADRAQIRKLNRVLQGASDRVVGTKSKAVRATIVGRFSAKQTLGVHAYTLYPISVTDIRVRYGEKSLIPRRPRG